MSHGAKSGAYIHPRRAERLLSEVADAWRDTWTDLEPKTRAGYDHILRKHLVGLGDPAVGIAPGRFARARVGAVSTEAVQRYVNELAETHAPNTVRRIFSVLRSVLRVAVERRYIAANPCDAVKLPRKHGGRNGARPKRMLFLNPPEVRALAAAMPRPSDRLAVYVAAYCGLRAGELWALRRSDVDLLHGTLSVERALKEINTSADQDKGLLLGPTKTHANRAMRLPAFLKNMLEQHLADPSPRGPGGVVVIRDTDKGPAFVTSTDPFDADALVFTTPTGCAVRHNLFYKRTFKAAAPAALPAAKRALRWHDLRHTCASLSLASTGSLHVVKERLGHDDIRTTINIYGHLTESVDAALADALDTLHSESAPDNVMPLRPVIGAGSSD